MSRVEVGGALTRWFTADLGAAIQCPRRNEAQVENLLLDLLDAVEGAFDGGLSF